MTKFSYSYGWFDSLDEFLAELNTLRELGWELICLVKTSGETHEWFAHFKRPEKEHE
jgi:hypothetical protein